MTRHQRRKLAATRTAEKLERLANAARYERNAAIVASNLSCPVRAPRSECRTVDPTSNLSHSGAHVFGQRRSAMGGDTFVKPKTGKLVPKASIDMVRVRDLLAKAGCK